MSEHQPLFTNITHTCNRLAVLIPCKDESLTIGNVVNQFRQELPDAKIYVYDNLSTDDTVSQAKKAGAIVRYEPQPGKGNVVRRMFADVEADIYILVDGDNTYEIEAISFLISKLTSEQLDMVVGARRSTITDKQAYRLGHRSGNIFLTGVVKLLFGAKLKDMLSGYRIFSRRFVKSFPAFSSGFEIETELTIHTLELKIPFIEEYTVYGSRPPGSESKLKTLTDGWRVLGTAILLFKEVKPFFFFSIISSILGMLSIMIGFPLITTYLSTGLVPRLPTAILTVAIMLLAFLSFTCGLILDSVARGRLEVKRMAYLSHSKMSYE